MAIDLNAKTYPIRVGELLSEIQRHMLEPVIDDGVSWQLWTFTEVLNYLRERCHQFYLRTELPQDLKQQSVSTRQVALDSTLVRLTRAASDQQGLLQVDRLELDLGTPGWESLSGTPEKMLFGPQDLSLTLVPAPATSALLEYVFIRSTPFDLPEGGAQANPESPDQGNSSVNPFRFYLLRVPAIFCWAIKYGVMADMLNKEGEANDPARARLFEQKFEDGVALALAMRGMRGE